MNARTFTGRVGLNVVIVMMVVGTIMVLLPFLLQIDMSDGGGALLLVGGLMAMTGMSLVQYFLGRVAVMRAIHNGEGILTWWHYDVPSWEKEKEKEIGELGIMKIGGFALAILFALIGIVIFLTDVEEMGLFLLIMLGLGALFILVSQISARVTAARLRITEDEAVIHPDGVFYRGTLICWRRGLTKLKAVGWDPVLSDHLVFCYLQFQKHGYQRAFLRIPIPKGGEQDAEMVVRAYRMPMDRSWREVCKDD